MSRVRPMLQSQPPHLEGAGPSGSAFQITPSTARKSLSSGTWPRTILMGLFFNSKLQFASCFTFFLFFFDGGKNINFNWNVKDLHYLPTNRQTGISKMMTTRLLPRSSQIKWLQTTTDRGGHDDEAGRAEEPAELLRYECLNFSSCSSADEKQAKGLNFMPASDPELPPAMVASLNLVLVARSS